MKHLLFISILFLLWYQPIDAQDQNFSLEEVTLNPWKFYGDDFYNTVWRGTSNKLNWVSNYSDFNELEAGQQNSKVLISLTELNIAFTEVGIEGSRFFPFDVSWLNDNSLLIEHDNKFIVFDAENKKVKAQYPYPEEAMNVKFCTQNNSIAYTIDNNLWLKKPNQAAIEITNDTNKGIVNGSDYVHRQEFGIDKGIFWSPTGKNVAFYRKDETMVDNYPLVNITTRIATAENIKYPMAGEKSEEVTLGVYNVESGKTIFVKTGEPKEQYLTNISWEPSGEFVYVAVLNRDQNHVKLNKYNAQTGDFVKTLFEEKNDKYVEPLHPLTFLESDPKKFIWWSMRDGFRHLYLYDTEGNLQKQLTSGSWEVTEILGLDEGDKNIFVITNEVSPIDRHIYKVNLKSGKSVRLSEAAGTHAGAVSKNGKYLLDKYSNLQTPNKINLIDANGKMLKNLLTVDNTLKTYNVGEQKVGTLKAADGTTDLYYSLILPPNFDANKKYPAVMYVYGGPHSQMVSNSWLAGISLWQFYMAQKGYVMITLDNRGTGFRGSNFEQATFRHLGQVEMQDQMKGIDFLKQLPYIDSERIGVHGWSFGGFMTISLMTNHADVFKVGVAGGPVIDWKYYEVMYGERYMDTPQTNPDGYENTSLIDKAADLKGKLLIIHGAVDPVVVWQHSMAFVEECIKKNVQVDYFMYPRHEHNVRGKDRLHLMTKITEYFDDYLMK